MDVFSENFSREPDQHSIDMGEDQENSQPTNLTRTKSLLGHRPWNEQAFEWGDLVNHFTTAEYLAAHSATELLAQQFVCREFAMPQQEEASLNEWSAGMHHPRRGDHSVNPELGAHDGRRMVEWPVDNANSQSIWRILSHLV
ncbi:proton channel OtopLc [Trichonephila clavipes]|nr:proton channel OtopLc [Trichonephila clavipes]